MYYGDNKIVPAKYPKKKPVCHFCGWVRKYTRLTYLQPIPGEKFLGGLFYVCIRCIKLKTPCKQEYWCQWALKWRQTREFKHHHARNAYIRLA